MVRKAEDGMNAKSVGLSTLILLLGGMSAVQGQYAQPVPNNPLAPAPSTSGSLDELSNPALTQPDTSSSIMPTPWADDANATSPTPPTELPHILSPYITRGQPCAGDCCGPIGGNGPLQVELYLRTGVSVPIGGGVFGHTLTPGWDITGGGRTLFFNTDRDRAWVLDFGLSNISNHGQHSDIHPVLENLFVPVPVKVVGGPTALPIPSLPVTVRSLNRTFASFGLGREWYLRGSAVPMNGVNCNNGWNWNWRAGLDAGVRYGTVSLDLHEIKHRTSTMGATYAAVHTDVEIPCGCCIFQFGGRLEWDYTWMDILQSQNNTNLQSINVLFTGGVRF